MTHDRQQHPPTLIMEATIRPEEFGTTKDDDLFSMKRVIPCNTTPYIIKYNKI